MKNKKKIIFVLLLIVLLFLIFIIKHQLLLNEVKSKFFSNVYEVKRNGNLHIVYNYYDPDGQSNQEVEMISANSETCTITKQGDDENITIMTPDNITVITSGKDYKNYYVQSNFHQKIWGRSLNGYDLLAYSELDVKNIQSIKKGEYRGKDCYVVTLESKVYPEEITIAYVNPENYMPYGVKTIIVNHDGQEIVSEYEYLEISIGTVEKIPEFDLTDYEEFVIPE